MLEPAAGALSRDDVKRCTRSPSTSIAPARYRADGHIGLVATPGGFGTPHFGDGERIRVDGSELVHERPGTTRRVPITTLDTPRSSSARRSVR